MKLVSVLDLDTSSFQAGLKTADDAVRVFERSINSSSGTIKDFAALLGGIGLTRIASDAVMAGDEMMSLQRKLSVIANSLNELAKAQGRANEATYDGAKVYAGLRDMATETGTSIKSLSQIYVQTIPVATALGVSVDTVNNVIKGTVGAAAMMGASHVELERSFLAIRQVIGKNQLQMEELKRQLGEALPNAMVITAKGLTRIANESPDVARRLDQIAGKARITTVELNNLVTAGKIDGKLFAEAWAAGTEEYQKYAEARSKTLSGQMVNFKTIIESNSGMFMSDGGITTALGVALKHANDNIDAWMKEQVAKAQTNGQVFINSFLNAGDGIAKHLDQTQDFHSQIGSTIGAMADTTLRGAESFWRNFPPEVREIGLVGMLFLGKSRLGLPGVLAGLTVRGAGFLTAFGLGLMDEILPERAMAKSFKWGYDLIAEMVDGAKTGMSQIGPALADDISKLFDRRHRLIPSPLTLANDGAPAARADQSYDDTLNARAKAMDEAKRKDTIKFVGGNLSKAMNEAQDTMDYLNFYQKRYEDMGDAGKAFGKVVGASANIADSWIEWTTSLGGLLGDGVRMFEPDEGIRATQKFQHAYSDWKAKFLKDFSETTMALKAMSEDGGLIEDMRPSGALRNTAMEQLRLGNQAVSLYGQSLAQSDPSAKILSDLERRMNHIREIDHGLKLNSSTSLEEGWDALPQFRDRGITGARMAEVSAVFQGIMSEAAKPAQRDTLSDTIAANEKQMGVFAKMADWVENSTDVPDSAKQQFQETLGQAMERFGRQLSITLDQVKEAEIGKLTFEARKTEGRAVAIERSYQEAETAYVERQLAKLDKTGTMQKVVDARAARERKEIETGARDPAATANTLSDTDLDAKRKQGARMRQQFSQQQQALSLTTYEGDRVFAAMFANQQALMEMGLMQKAGYRGLLGDGRERQVQLATEQAKLELELHDRDSYRAALIDQEMTKLRQEEKTLRLQLEVYANDGHREQIIRNEMAKLDLEMEKLAEERALYSSPEYRAKLDASTHAKAALQLTKTQDETRLMGTGQYRDDAQRQAYAELARDAQKLRNEIDLMRMGEWQRNDMAKVRLDLERQIEQLYQDQRRYQDAAVMSEMNRLDIEKARTSNMDKARANSNMESPEYQAVQHQSNLLDLKRQEVQLQQQIYSMQDAAYGSMLNANTALQGRVEMMQLLNSYTMSFTQYMQTGAASAVRTFTDTMSNGIVQVITGQKHMKSLFQDIAQLIVGGLIKAVVEFGVRMLVVTAMSEIFGVKTEQNTERTIAGTAATTAAGLSALAISTVAGMEAAAMLEEAWVPAALAASIASWGAAAFVGTAAMLVGLGITEAAFGGLGGLLGGAAGGAGGGAGGAVGDFGSVGDAGVGTMLAHDGGLFGNESTATIRERYKFDRPLRGDEGFAVLQHGEMIVPTKNVAATVAAMKMSGIPLPEGVYHNGGIFGQSAPFGALESSWHIPPADALSTAGTEDMSSSVTHRPLAINVIAVLDPAEVDRHISRNPGATLTAVSMDYRNNGVMRKMIRSGR
ncbi:tape measure protein [Magnetospirillum sp. 15-1]|uniref:tape measure protein n=1 Tax=Magnetospirillum sp. 15-1 TaxID=1979370 RepID=UPI001481D8DC|nr:tape measure protein [Magnetospirillum sp. 15-1]